MKKILIMIIVVIVSQLTGCAHKQSIPHYGVEGSEQEVILWLQAHNPTPGSKRAFFHKPELWIVGLDGKKRSAVIDQNFSEIKRQGRWDGSNYPGKNGPVGNTTPTNERFDVSCWQVDKNGVLSVTVSREDHFYDLWHVRSPMKPGEYIIAAANVQTEGDVRVRIGVDFWARDDKGRDTTNRPKFTEWKTPVGKWTKVVLPE